MRTVVTTILAALLATAAPARVVGTAEGPVAGTEADGVEAWRGIPVAAPPVGALRWRAPQPVAHWQGVRDATAYGHDCMQVPFPSDAAPLGTPPAEDCLYLNVWRPVAARGPLPILVWIYGGGFVNGGASPPTYAGAALAKAGLMVVSFNYRVGRFGTFAHPVLTRADPDHGLLGNYGYLDQLAALRWVQRNAAAFGGDPAQVTIVGESAGAMSVHTLLTSPLARGLFARAVAMSGGDGSGMAQASLRDVEAIGTAFASSKGIAPDDPQALAKLRALSADAVTDGLNMTALFTPGPRTFAAPFADGRIAVDVPAAYRAGAFAHVPVMIGATSADIGGPTGFMIAGARRAAATLARQGVPVYLYRFGYVADAARDPAHPGAPHASDIPFFLHTEDVKYGAKTTPTDRAMGRTVSGYLVNFVRTGDPNGTMLPDWPRYDPAADMLMRFTPEGTAEVAQEPRAAELDR